MYTGYASSNLVRPCGGGGWLPLVFPFAGNIQRYLRLTAGNGEFVVRVDPAKSAG